MINKLHLITLLLNLVAVHSKLSTRIVNGTEVIPDFYPYIAYVTVRNYRAEIPYAIRCAGTLIARDVVLTARHCYYNQSDPRSVNETFVVTLSEHDLVDFYDNDSPYGVSDIAGHSMYDESSNNYDFLLLKLDRLADSSQILMLNDGLNDFMDEGTSLSVMGWGQESEFDNSGSEVLRETQVNVADIDECHKIYGDISKDAVVCAYEEYTDACQGDSGGPLVYRQTINGSNADVQIGVVSKGIGCARLGIPGVYANVAHVYADIATQLCKWDTSITHIDCGEYPSTAPSNFNILPAQQSFFSAQTVPTATPSSASGYWAKRNCMLVAAGTAFVTIMNAIFL